MNKRPTPLQRILSIGFTTAAFAAACVPIALVAASGSADAASSLASLDSKAMRLALTGPVLAPEAPSIESQR